MSTYDPYRKQESEIDRLRAENERLMALITDAAQSLAELSRMPNAEHLADIHNAAVERIRKAALRGEGE